MCSDRQLMLVNTPPYCWQCKKPQAVHKKGSTIWNEWIFWNTQVHLICLPNQSASKLGQYFCRWQTTGTIGRNLSFLVVHNLTVSFVCELETTKMQLGCRQLQKLSLLVLRIVTIAIFMEFSFFLLAIEDGFKRIKACLLWSPYAKVTRAQIFIGKCPKTLGLRKLDIKVVDVLKINMYNIYNTLKSYNISTYWLQM